MLLLHSGEVDGSLLSRVLVASKHSSLLTRGHNPGPLLPD